MKNYPYIETILPMSESKKEKIGDVYFSADVETDGPIPGKFSLLSFAFVYAGRFKGTHFERPDSYDQYFYRELKPIYPEHDREALLISRLDRKKLCESGCQPEQAMTEAANWIRNIAGQDRPILVGYPLVFDWMWLYWYFVQYSLHGSPFNHSGGFDLKTAYAIKKRIPIAASGKKNIDPAIQSKLHHTHHALDDARNQAEIFANLMEWSP